MRARQVYALVAIAIGLLGLAIDFWIIMGSAPVDVDGRPMVRGPIGQFVYFWSFFTHLTNLGLLLFYLADLTGWRVLNIFRIPTWRASMAGMIALVMVFFHFMLAPNYTFTGGLLVANYLLHYVTPILFLLWWFALTPHGTLRYRDVPVMLVPGLIYTVLVLIRGAITTDYPYAILNAAKAGYTGVAIGVAIILAAVGVFCCVLVAADRPLGTTDRMSFDNAIAITPKLVADHGLKPDEYQRILDLIGRTPTLTELGIFSAMWNEHCSYKSSKKWLRTLPTTGPRVIQGPGENAGVVDIGDGQAIVFKMESHNHPSFIEPYQGAATGVGGILRDVFTMGARPVAAMNALRFGDPAHEKTRHLVAGVVGGVGGYGNSFGVPVVGGEVEFDARYNGNILVNAFAAGLADTDKIFYSKAEGVGLPVVYLGAKTGRDGVGGATMASAEFGDDIEQKRPTVQVGDPFTEKRLLEACLELMATGAVVAIQDMGAAGLTCSAVEMGAKGDLGIRLDLDAVPVREDEMTPYEMMLSESQERMLMVLHPQREAAARAVFEKWELDFATVGVTTDDLRFRVVWRGEEVANLPIKDLGDAAPEYDRPWTKPAPAKPLGDVPEMDVSEALLLLVGGHHCSSRRWVYEQYDTLIQGNSLQRPGGDAGLIRVEGHDTKALAFSSDVTPRYCEADPYEGGKQAVAECWRNLTAVGAEPLAATDNLNFGNPERSEIMGQLVEAVRGIGDACRVLGFPIVSGNVSLYNETNGRGILPTPTIGGVGLVNDWGRTAGIGFVAPGEAIFLIGAPANWGTHLGQSIYLRDLFGRVEGPAPPVDLNHELKVGDFVRGLIRDGIATAVHDLSDGGLGVALAEMAMRSGIGAGIGGLEGQSPAAVFFGEDQGRYLVTVRSADVDRLIDDAEGLGIYAPWIGSTGQDTVQLGDARAVPIAELRAAHEGWFPAYMQG